MLKGLDQLIAWRGKPKRIRSDNGPEYISDSMQRWCEQHSIEHFYNHEQPHMSVDGKPPNFKQ